MSGVDFIATERQRQLDDEGWTPEHDDIHTLGELAVAGACYALLCTTWRDSTVLPTTRILACVGGVLLCYLAAFVVTTGFWLLTQTEYPFVRTVGGATLVFGSLAAVFMVFIAAEVIEGGTR